MESGWCAPWRTTLFAPGESVPIQCRERPTISAPVVSSALRGAITSFSTCFGIDISGSIVPRSMLSLIQSPPLVSPLAVRQSPRTRRRGNRRPCSPRSLTTDFSRASLVIPILVRSHRLRGQTIRSSVSSIDPAFWDPCAICPRSCAPFGPPALPWTHIRYPTRCCALQNASGRCGGQRNPWT